MIAKTIHVSHRERKLIFPPLVSNGEMGQLLKFLKAYS